MKDKKYKKIYSYLSLAFWHSGILAFYLLQDTPGYIEPSGYPGLYNLFILLLFFHESRLSLFCWLLGKNTD
jgi:hypothetical protein